MEYSLVRPEASPSSLLIVATERRTALAELLNTHLETIAAFTGYSLLSTTYHDPLSSPASVASPPRPIIPADYVTATTGTGLVHTAPAHGVEDWDAWRAYHLAQLQEEGPSSERAPVPDTLCAVDAEGRLDATLREMGLEENVVQRLVGKDILSDGTAEVIRMLKERGRLLKEVEVEHKFPYDWRTKQPVIYRYVLPSLGNTYVPYA